MADPTPGTSDRFDRIRSHADPPRRARDGQGKEALYSTSPAAAPGPQIQVRCGRCGREAGLSLREAVRLLRPPVLYDPRGARLWARCPACGRRAWLAVRAGQALRVLLQRTPRG